MLLRFGVSNHLSFRDEQELLFTASSLRDRQEGLIECAAAPSGSIVPVVVIYGANASGKSNLIHAMKSMRSFVLSSQTQGDPGGGVPRQAFRLDAASSGSSSRFDLDFVLGDVRYHYGFETNDTEFESEWLYAFPKRYRRMLFERHGDNYRFGRELRGRNRVIADLTRPNSLFVSAAAQNRHEQLSEVFEYFLSLRNFMSISVPRSLSDWPHRGRRRRAGVLRWRNNNLGNKPIWGSAWRLIWDIIGAVKDSRRSIHGRRLSRA